MFTAQTKRMMWATCVYTWSFIHAVRPPSLQKLLTFGLIMYSLALSMEIGASDTAAVLRAHNGGGDGDYKKTN